MLKTEKRGSPASCFTSLNFIVEFAGDAVQHWPFLVLAFLENRIFKETGSRGGATASERGWVKAFYANTRVLFNLRATHFMFIDLRTALWRRVAVDWGKGVKSERTTRPRGEKRAKISMQLKPPRDFREIKRFETRAELPQVIASTTFLEFPLDAGKIALSEFFPSSRLSGDVITELF